MMKQKSPHDVYGWQHDCPNFQQCPVCYGCRNYDSSVVKCYERCGRNMKKNVCNTQRHKDNLIAKLLTKETIHI